MPRIALVLSAFPRLTETFIVQHFTGLLDAGWDVHVVCSHFSSKDWDHFPALKDRPEIRARVHSFLPTDNKWLAALLFFPMLFFTLLTRPVVTWRYFHSGWRLLGWRVCKHFYLDQPLIQLRPDLIHIEFGALAVGREHLGQCLACRLVVSFRGYDLNFSGLDDPKYYTRVWEAADALHLLGEDLWQRTTRRGCPPEKPHALIPPAVNLDDFQSAPDKRTETICAARSLRILSVGRLEWKKGYEYGLQAVQMVEQAGVAVEYHIVGGGDYLEALTFARRQLCLERTVHFLGPLNQAAVIQQYQWADLLLHPSLSEGFCNTVLEAQAMGLPCIVTDAGGLPENIADEVTGFVVPRRRPAEMAAKIIHLAVNPEKITSMGQAGRDRVTQLFRQDDQIQSFENLYRAVLGMNDTH